MPVNKRYLFFLVVYFSFFSEVWGNNNLNDINALTKIVNECVNRKDTRHHIFHGCIDWHSSVHGHWALLYSAKANNAIPSTILKSLNSADLRNEMELLQRSDQNYRYFETPYGRAWFLQLARDSETLYSHHELREMADYVYASLLDYARKGGGNFLSQEYDNASWYYYQLYRWAEHINDNNGKSFIKESAITRLTDLNDWPAVSRNTGFFEPKTLALLLIEAIGGEDQLEKKLEQDIIAEGLNPVRMPFRTAHQGGLNFSRAWGLWSLYRLTENENYKTAWQNHMRYMLDNIDQWQYDYGKYGHWVGQFGLLSFRIAED